MPVTNYITANGMLIGEMTSGTMTAYGPDALGSVVVTYSGNSLQNTYQYKPYGGTLAKTGTGADPSFLWNGGSGYRATNLSNAAFYVHARHYSSRSGQWTSQDALWPRTASYSYANSDPVNYIDPSGMLSWPIGCCGQGLSFELLNISNVPSINRGVTNFTARFNFQVGKTTFRDGIPLPGQTCGATWWEMTNVPPDDLKAAGMQENTWFNVSAQCSESTPGWCTWSDLVSTQQALAHPCTSPAQVSFSDEKDDPTFLNPNSITKSLTRCYCWKLVSSGGCFGPDISLQFNQTVSFFNDNTPTVIFPNDPITADYCSGVRRDCKQDRS